MHHSDSLIAALVERVNTGRATDFGSPAKVPFSKLATTVFEAEEERLGFLFPPILRRIYTEIGNGGFGPGYGLLTLTPVIPAIDETIRSLYTKLREARLKRSAEWRAGTVPLNSWGDMILSCVDLSDSGNDDPPVIRYEPNMPEAATREYVREGPFRGAGLIPECEHLSHWLKDWLEGREMFKRPYL